MFLAERIAAPGSHDTSLQVNFTDVERLVGANESKDGRHHFLWIELRVDDPGCFLEQIASISVEQAVNFAVCHKTNCTITNAAVHFTSTTVL